MNPKIFLLLVLVVAAGGITYRKITTLPKRHSDALADVRPPEKSDDAPQSETSEEKHLRLLPGVWQDEFQGKRTMTLNEDGSSTMVVELCGVQASLFAAKLRFDMKRSLNGDKLVKTTVEGEPAKKVNQILKMMGDTAEDTILEITDERLLLLDNDGSTEYDWKRIQQDVPSKE